ncbi:MAG: hypothetical protein FWH25_02250 [Syntrophorhabdaceae bacterium]|nr:hypothetical protein [Syntrophorhabdaceae bacterium]
MENFLSLKVPLDDGFESIAPASPSRLGIRVLAALLAAALLVLQAGCGRKAKPEPRSASQVAAFHVAAACSDITQLR